MMSRIRRTGLVMALVLVAFITLLVLPGRIAYAAPVAYTVTIAADDAGAAADCANSANTDCSLRSAINASNGNAPGTGATNTINFVIGTGSQTITLTTALPDVTAPVVIDGTSQPDFAGAPIIEVRGDSAGAGVNWLDTRGLGEREHDHGAGHRRLRRLGHPHCVEWREQYDHRQLPRHGRHGRCPARQ